MGGMQNDASLKSLKATQCIKWNVNNEFKSRLLMMLVIQFLYTQKQKFHFRKYFRRYSKKYLSNATQLTYLIKTCIFLMLLYLCFATRKNYALIGSIISSIHTQNGFEHQQFIVQGVKKLCYFRKCQYLNNQINAPISNLWKLCRLL